MVLDEKQLFLSSSVRDHFCLPHLYEQNKLAKWAHHITPNERFYKVYLQSGAWNRLFDEKGHK